MDGQQQHTKRVARRVAGIGGAVAVTAAALAVFAPAADAGTTTVSYTGCTSSNPQLSAPPPNYTSQVTLTPQGSSFQAGKAISITWHYSISTAPGPVGIPVANVATAKAKILISGAASSTVTTGSSANFPPAPVAAGGTFQIPDMTATFTPTAAGTYKLTPGDNEQDIAQFGLVVACKGSASGAAATITVGPASGGGGGTPTSSSKPSTSGSSSASGGSSSSSSASGGSTDSSGSTSTGAEAGSGSSSSTTGVLPHTGFDGRWLAGGAVLAAVLGGTGLYATRRRRGSHS